MVKILCKDKRRFIFEYVWLVAVAKFIRKCKISLTKNVVLNIDKGVRLCYYLYINIIIGAINNISLKENKYIPRNTKYGRSFITNPIILKR